MELEDHEAAIVTCSEEAGGGVCVDGPETVALTANHGGHSVLRDVPYAE